MGDARLAQNCHSERADPDPIGAPLLPSAAALWSRSFLEDNNKGTVPLVRRGELFNSAAVKT